MTEKEKEQKALDFYKLIMHVFADITDKEGLIENVNVLIGEDGLFSSGEAKGLECNARWGVFIEGMLSSDSLSILSEKCGIVLSTAHNQRMKPFSPVSNYTRGYFTWGTRKLLSRMQSFTEKKEAFQSLTTTQGTRTVKDRGNREPRNPAQPHHHLLV